MQNTCAVFTKVAIDNTASTVAIDSAASPMANGKETNHRRLSLILVDIKIKGTFCDKVLRNRYIIMGNGGGACMDGRTVHYYHVQTPLKKSLFVSRHKL